MPRPRREPDPPWLLVAAVGLAPFVIALTMTQVTGVDWSLLLPGLAFGLMLILGGIGVWLIGRDDDSK